MKRLLKNMLLTGSLVALASTAFASDPNRIPRNDPNGFELNGVVWNSQKDFVESGKRCATKHPDMETMAELELAHQM